MIQYLFDNLLTIVVTILILVVIGFYFFPDATKHLMGYAIASSKPVLGGGLSALKKFIVDLVPFLH